MKDCQLLSVVNPPPQDALRHRCPPLPRVKRHSLLQSARSATVPASVLYELHSKLSSVFQELNSLGYKRLGGVADSLVDMNVYIKEQITQAKENSRQSQVNDVSFTPLAMLTGRRSEVN